MSRIFTYRNFKIFNAVIMVILVVLTLFPFLYMLAISFSDSHAVARGEVVLLPVKPGIHAYRHIVSQVKFWTSYRNTIFYTVTGTIISLFLTVTCSYPLSKKNLYGGQFLLKFITFTMFFSGGLIPSYLLIRELNMMDKVWAIVLPGAISAYNVMIMKTFFQGIPSALEDSARIDGLNDIGILIKIILPLSKPILATIGLFVAVWLWNDWFMSLIYLSSDEKRPVSMFLRNLVMGMLMTIRDSRDVNSDISHTIPQTIQASTIMLTSIPILLVYPFVQKYFAKGMLIGSIKG